MNFKYQSIHLKELHHFRMIETLNENCPSVLNSTAWWYHFFLGWSAKPMGLPPQNNKTLPAECQWPFRIKALLESLGQCCAVLSHICSSKISTEPSGWPFAACKPAPCRWFAKFPLMLRLLHLSPLGMKFSTLLFMHYKTMRKGAGVWHPTVDDSLPSSRPPKAFVQKRRCTWKNVRTCRCVWRPFGDWWNIPKTLHDKPSDHV